MSCETREQSLKNKHIGRERQLGARHKRAVNDTGAIHKGEVHYRFKTKVRSAICHCEGEVRDASARSRRVINKRVLQYTRCETPVQDRGV